MVSNVSQQLVHFIHIGYPSGGNVQRSLNFSSQKLISKFHTWDKLFYFVFVFFSRFSYAMYSPNSQILLLFDVDYLT